MAELVRFRPTFLDTVRTVREVGRGIPWVRWVRALGWSLPLAGIALLATAPRAAGVGATLVLAGVLLVLFDLLAPLLAAWKERYDNPTAGLEMVVTVDEAGLAGTVGATRSFLSWSDVIRVGETARYFLVFTSAHSARSIPKRAFPSEASLAAFRALAAAHAGRPAGEETEAGAVEPIGPPRLDVTFRWTPRERFQAEADLRRHGSLSWTRVLVTTLVLVAVLVPLAGEIGREGLDGVRWGAQLARSLPLLLILVIGRPLGSLWAARMQERTSRLAHQEQRVLLGEWGIRAVGTRSGGSVQWEALARAVETRRYFLFYLNGEGGLTLPKRLLSPEQVRSTREFLEEKLGFNFIGRR